MLFVIIKMILNAVGENLFLINNSVILKSQDILGSKILYLETCAWFFGLSWKEHWTKGPEILTRVIFLQSKSDYYLIYFYREKSDYCPSLVVLTL